MLRVAETGMIRDDDDERTGSVPGGEIGVCFGFYGAEIRVDEGDYRGDFMADEV